MAIVRQKTFKPVEYFFQGLKWSVLGFFLLFTLVPLIWLFISSFKTNLELQMQPFALPDVWQFQNYINAVQISGLPRLFLNSVFVSTVSTAIAMLVTSMAAFVFAREKFPLQQTLMNLIIAGVLVPIVGLMAPYFRLTNRIGLYDNLWALVLTYAAINIPISTFLLHGFMRTIPKELEEAVVIDGASFFQRYWRIILPLSRVGIVTAGTFVFLFSWNEFIYALLLTSSMKARTLQLGIRFFTSQFFTDYTSMFAAIVLTIIPSILVYVFLHEKIIKGLAAGAVKG